MTPPVLVLDGAAFTDLDGFAREFSRLLTGHTWHGNLDAFNDILRGGLGTPAGSWVLRWVNSAASRAALGYPATVHRLSGLAHPDQDRLRAAERGEGPTLFDELVEIIRDHAADGVRLELRLMDPFAGADPAWRSCFRLAWAAFQAGSVPVGAVLVDAGGAEVRSGRNRTNEPAGPPGQVAGSFIAHAEINALATLAPGDYPGHTLYTTLEPCFLCTTALRHSHVGTVRFAAPDPLWHGVERMPELNEQFARRWSRRLGPLGGHLQTWAALLPLVSAVERGGAAAQHSYAETMPGALALARQWAGETADRLRALDLESAMTQTWPAVAAAR